eukprot:s637_g38.t1
MGTEEGGVKRARQNALLRRQVAESAIASHGGSKRNVMALLSPRPAGSFSAAKVATEQAKTARQVLPHEVGQARHHRPSGALSARGREVIQTRYPTRTEKVDSAMSTLSTKRTSVESIISDSKETRSKCPVEQQSILPRGSMLHRGTVLPRGSIALSAMKARPDLQYPGTSDQAESGQVCVCSSRWLSCFSGLRWLPVVLSGVCLFLPLAVLLQWSPLAACCA